jgi:hypothetical protein
MVAAEGRAGSSAVGQELSVVSSQPGSESAATGLTVVNRSSIRLYLSVAEKCPFPREISLDGEHGAMYYDLTTE